MKIVNNYDGASAEIVEVKEEKNEAYLSIKKEGNVYGYYYNFIVENDKEDVAIIHIVNFEKSPYYKEGNIPIPYIWNKEKNAWYKIEEKYFDATNEKDIKITIKPNTKQEISLFPRYNEQDLEIFLNSIKNNKMVKIKENGVLKEIVIGNEKLPTIVIIGRQHPGETLSSFFIEELINKILKSKETEKYCFVIYPLVNRQGVKNGTHRLINGVDYNRSWGEKNPPEEIKYIEKQLNRYKLKMFIDIHCDEITKKHYIRTNRKNGRNEILGIQVLEDMSKVRRFLRALLKQRKIVKFSKLTAREYVAKKYNCNSLLIELSLKQDFDMDMNKRK